MIIGALIGLAGSIIPEVVKIFKEKQDFKHEKEMLLLQIQYQKELTELKIQEARALSTLELDKASYQYAPVEEIQVTGNKVIDFIQAFAKTYNQTVRPTLTYLIVACWIIVKIATWTTLGGSIEAIPKIWTDADNEFVSAVVMFWFGGRAFGRVFNRQ